MDWDNLKTVLALGRAGSVRGASTRLGVAHSTVSRRLEAIETTLGARLFRRVAEGLIPTALGERVIGHSERIEAETIALERHVLGDAARLAGAVTISLPPPLLQHLLMPHLVAFGQRHPQIEVVTVPTYALSDLARRGADIALRFSEAPDPYLFGRRTPDFAEAAYATPAYLASHRLEGEEPTAHWIGWSDAPQDPGWIARSPHPELHERWRIPEPLGQMAAAEAGLGIALLPCFLGDPNPALVRVPPGEIAVRRSGWVLTHPDLKTNERVRTCVRFLTDALAGQADLLEGRAPALSRPASPGTG